MGGDTGELALMHHGDTLSFAYLAVFGERAHVCEGAGVAGLTATDRYEFVDEQGAIAFVIEPLGVRVALVSGIASFCGAGWAGETLSIERFEAPGECFVAAERARYHVVDTVDRQRRPQSAPKGARLQVVPVPDSTGEWLLARGTEPDGTTVGMVRRHDVECRADRADGEAEQ